MKKSTITDPESHTTTYTEEDLKEVKLANYRVQVILSKKGTTDDPGEELQYDTAQTWGGTGRIKYSFKRGTGRLVPSIASSDYCDISVVGSDTFKVIISTASGKCMLDD